MAELLTWSALMAFVALAALEIVLGVDNLVFIAVFTERLPLEKQAGARRLGLALAAGGRIVLLLAASWVITLDEYEVVHVGQWSLTIHDLILLLGGAFLIGKATWEIHQAFEGHAHEAAGQTEKRSSYGNIIFQIVVLDIVFSIDSVLTAVGMVEPTKYESAPIPLTTIPWPAMLIMAGAILSAVAVMLFFIGPVSGFIKKHPTVKMLALSFLLLIGTVLVADGLHQHIPRGYIYFAMGFSVFVEILNITVRRRRLAAAQKKKAASAGAG